MKLFPNFTSILFDYLFITWVTNYVRNRGFRFSKAEYFDKIPLRILHDVLCRVRVRFSKASFNALTSQFIEF